MDIFGKKPTDYAHIRDMINLGAWDDHCRALQDAGHAPHDFNALGRGRQMGYRDHGPYDLLGTEERAESNAQTFGYMTSNLEAIIAQADEVLYLGGERVRNFIPIRTDVAMGATEYSHRVIDYTGMGRFIETAGRSAPQASAVQRRVPVPLGYGGIDGIFTLEDVRRAMFTGFPLDSATIKAAMMGAVNHIAKVAFQGDDELVGHTQGLVNQPTTTGNVTLTDLTSETWATRTNEQIIAHLRAAISRIIVASAEVFPMMGNDPLVIALPTAQFDLVTSVRYGEGADSTIARWFSRNNPWTQRGGGEVLFLSLPELDSANSIVTTDRMVVYPKSTDCLEQAHAISPRMLELVDKGREYCAQHEYKVGPLFVGRVALMQYVDGI